MDYGIYWQSAHNHYSCSKVNSSGILTCSLSGLIFIYFSFGVLILFLFLILLTFMSYFISFSFGVYFFFLIFSFLSPLIFLLGLLPSFHFLFSNMGKQLAKSKVCTYLQDYQSQFKIYEPYYYRTLTSCTTVHCAAVASALRCSRNERCYPLHCLLHHSSVPSE